MRDNILSNLQEHVDVGVKCLSLASSIESAARLVVSSLRSGNKLLICGNGGSAADAQHFAAELVGRYRKERKALPAIALTTDSSSLTAISNDYGYDRVFSRQVESLAAEGDVIFAISTSGNSVNVVNAVNTAKTAGCSSISLSGGRGGKLGSLCDVNIIVPSDSTPRIQEFHITCIHVICDIVDAYFTS